MQEENLVARSLCTRSHASIALSPVAIWRGMIGFLVEQAATFYDSHCCCCLLPVLLCRGGLGRKG